MPRTVEIPPGEPADDVEIIRAVELDLEAYAAFQRAAFGDLLDRKGASDHHMTPGLYRWKYRTPAGEGRVATISRGGEILSSCAAMPLRATVFGATVTAWHCVDVATRPTARRRGRFRTALAALVESLPAGDLAFAFPNASSIAAFLDLGFVENGIMTTWICPFTGLIRKRRTSVRRIDRFSVEHSGIGWVAAASCPHVGRRPDYLNWRYADNPSSRYTFFVHGGRSCDGLCVVRRASISGRDVALVMDLIGSTPNVEHELLTHVADWAVGNGLGRAAVMSTSIRRSAALRALLIPIPSALLPKRQVLVVHAEGGPANPATRTSWAVQTGDWDVF